MKNCFKCGEQKPLTEFYRHPRMTDGHLGKCKDCTKRDVQQNYRSRRAKFRGYDRERTQRAERKAQKAEYNRRYRARYPEKIAAHQAVAHALRDGTLERKPCQACGTKENVHAHHRDYSRPLDVRWLCVNCHCAEHGRSAVGAVAAEPPGRLSA